LNRKTNSICLSTLLAVATATSLPATAGILDAPHALTRGGGQAPSAPSGGSTFAVRVASNLDKAAADSLKQDLVKEGFTAAESRPASGGQYEVVIAGITARAQAERIVEDLKGSGYTTSVEIIGDGAAAVAASPGTGQTIYRVKVAEFDTAAEATEASKVLIEERFVNVDIVEDNGKHVLMLGTFNREQDAQALLGDVNGAGFALASVVKREKLNTGSSAAQADLSSLPAAQQADTRDVLAMAEKVESGEATAEEVKQLRQRIEQLTENQKAIITQQESNRSAEQNKIQKTYPIYREFDQAIRAKNFDRAEQLLAQVRQINPNDIFLSGKERMLAEQRSGGSAPVASQPATGAPVDPAQLQETLNQARQAEAGGDKSGALQKYRAVLALDPTNVEARGKVSDLESPAAGAAITEADSPKDNKMLIYGGAALAALILLLFGWMKMRGKRTPVSESAPSTPSYSFDAVDPLASASPASADTSSLGASGAMGGAGLATTDMSAMPGMHSFGIEDEEEPKAPVSKPAPAPAPAPESDSVSLEDMLGQSSPPSTAGATPESAPADDLVSLNFDEETAPAATSSSASSSTPAGGSSAMDADLEALLKGTFAGASESESANIGDQVLASGAAGAAAASKSQPAIVFAQDFASAESGSTPEGWRGEYDYATLSVADLNEAGHSKVLMFEKNEGAGSATYHLSFPKASGKVIAEFDLRCDQKNKFLLGVYFEKDEDFKQSIHTIVHQLDPNAPATLRVQGESAPYEMGTWSHLRFEVDLNNGTIDAYMDDNHIVKGTALTVVPEYINTLSIRDNLATTGTLYLDSIRVSEA